MLPGAPGDAAARQPGGIGAADHSVRTEIIQYAQTRDYRVTSTDRGEERGSGDRFDVAAPAAATRPSPEVRATRSIFGTLPDGCEVPAVTLVNSHGVSARVIAHGAALQSLMLPGRTGEIADVTLGYATIEEYLAGSDYLGATVGRFANRLASGKCAIEGELYRLPLNDGANSLHGGTTGFDRALWELVSVASGPIGSATFRHVSPDGDQGYPGTLTIEATYSLDEGNRLTIDYVATTDRPTIVNITNHAYWNLAGEGAAESALGHVVTIPGDSYLPADAGSIPTGEFRPVAGTAFDFRTPRAVGDRIRDAGEEQLRFAKGYDHNWVVTRTATPDEHLMARVCHPASGRGFELWSNQPGVQFYSANFLDGSSAGKAGRSYRQGDAIVLEPQVFPDSPNQIGFPDARLVPGQTYRNVMSYRFTTER